MNEVAETIKLLEQGIETRDKLIEDYEKLFGILRQDFPEAWKALHKALHEMQAPKSSLEALPNSFGNFRR